MANAYSYVLNPCVSKYTHPLTNNEIEPPHEVDISVFEPAAPDYARLEDMAKRSYATTILPFRNLSTPANRSDLAPRGYVLSIDGHAPFTRHLMRSNAHLFFGVAVAELAVERVDSVKIAQELQDALNATTLPPTADSVTDSAWTPYADLGSVGVYRGTVVAPSQGPTSSRQYVVAVAGLNYDLLQKALAIQSESLNHKHTVLQAMEALEPVRAMAVENRRRLVAFAIQVCRLTPVVKSIELTDEWPAGFDRNLYGKHPTRAVCRDATTDDFDVYRDHDTTTVHIRTACSTTFFKEGFVPIMRDEKTMSLYAWQGSGYPSDDTLHSLPCRTVGDDGVDMRTLRELSYVHLESVGHVKGLLR